MAAVPQRQRDIAERISSAFVEAYNTGEGDRIDDVVTADFVCHHKASGEELHGAEEYKRRIAEMQASISDFEMTQEHLIVDGEMGAGQYRWRGTHTGEFAGMPASGNEVDTTSLTMFRMDGDRLAEMWVYGDAHGLMAQLGGR